jgi:predicted component of type VI protein secretion system
MIENIARSPQDYELSKVIECCLKKASWSSLKIRSSPSFSAISSQVISFQKDANHSFVIESSFLNVTGVYGGLPYCDTERFLRSPYREAFRDFLDLFHQRLYMVWHKIETQNPLQETRKSLSKFLQKRSKEAIRLMLENILKIPVSIEPFQGKWIEAEQEEQSKIGFKEGRYTTLGTDAILGKRVWKQNDGIKINIGPMSYQAFCYFLSENGKKILTHLMKPYDLKALFYIYVKNNSQNHLALDGKKNLGQTTWMHASKDRFAWISL